MTAHFGKFIAYYRVSTDAQGRSGLGLAAQKAAVKDRLNGGPWKLVGEFTEVESGRKRRRPQLEAALAACKKQGAKLIVAKLDRLTRNVGFLHQLLDSKVDPLFCDLPEVTGAMGRFILIGMANVAELEAGLISERTKAGLAQSRKRLGRYGAKVLAPRLRKEARQRAKALRPVIYELQDQGLSLRAMARELTKRKVPTPRGGHWHPQLVARVVERLS